MNRVWYRHFIACDCHLSLYLLGKETRIKSSKICILVFPFSFFFLVMCLSSHLVFVWTIWLIPKIVPSMLEHNRKASKGLEILTHYPSTIFFLFCLSEEHIIQWESHFSNTIHILRNIKLPNFCSPVLFWLIVLKFINR